MPDELIGVVFLLVLGYVLLLLEIVVPGGILGVLGAACVLFGCYQAFQHGTGWGTGAVALSVAVGATTVWLFFRSRAGRKLVLDGQLHRREGWTSSEKDLDALLGQEGIALSALRPAGVAQLGERRIDVVSDSEFLDAGVRVRVVEVEGRRVMVEPVAERSAARDEPGSVVDSLTEE